MVILNFIKSIREKELDAVVKYTTGQCYSFFFILLKQFPDSEAWYNDDHIITEIGDKFYDITGEVNKTNHLKVNDYYTYEFMNKIFNI